VGIAGRIAGMPGNVQGMLMMLSATAFTSGMHAVVNLIALGMHPFEIYFLRQFAGLIIPVPPGSCPSVSARYAHSGSICT
jgi:hypothetical protein